MKGYLTRVKVAYGYICRAIDEMVFGVLVLIPFTQDLINMLGDRIIRWGDWTLYYAEQLSKD